MSTQIRRLIGSFSRDRRATTSLLFAVTLLPLGGAAGVAVDYSRVSTVRTKLQAMADAAALAAAAPASGSLGFRSQQRGWRQDEAKRIFEGQVPPELRDIPRGLKVEIQETGQRVEAIVSFEASVPMYFGKLIGLQTVAVAGKAHALLDLGQNSSASQQSQSAFNDVFLLLDMSASMWLPADDPGRDRLVALTRPDPAFYGNGCAFACHQLTTGQSGPTNLEVARSAGITLRTDVLQESVGMLLAEMERAQRRRGQNRAAIVRFDLFTDVVMPITEDLAAAARAARGLLPGSLTRLERGVEQIDSMVDRQGRGTSELDRRKWVVIATDGVVTDTPWNEYWKPRPFDARICQPLKDKGVDIIVLRTRYLEIPGYPDFEKGVRPILPAIEPQMRACASPGMFFDADQGDEIRKAIAFVADAITQKSTPAAAARTPRLVR